ncbi:MAG: hypothetical protein E7497_00680 [Ruminococcus sp.]|nr:hypothetical protein [Ruminococcus sp.]
MAENNKKISAIIGGVVLAAAAAGIIFLTTTDEPPTERASSSQSAGINRDNGPKVQSKGSASVVFAAPQDSNATEEQLKEAAAVIEERILDYYILDFVTSVNAQDKTVSLDFSWDLPIEFDAEAMVKEVSREYHITVKEGNGEYLDGADDGDIIAENADIADAVAIIETNDKGKEEYFIEISFTEDAKQKYIDATERLAGTDKQIAFWIDNSMMYAADVEKKSEDGVLKIGTRCFTLDDAHQYACAIENGSLPFAMNVKSFEESK